MPGDEILVGENFAVTPLGNPLTDSATAALNPFIPTAFNVNVDEPPAVTLPLAEFAVMANVGTTTTRLIVCVFVWLPLTPLTVTMAGPSVAVVAALSVSVLDPFPGDAMLVGEKLAVTPLGNPVAESDTAPLNPPSVADVTVTLLGVPAVNVKLAALVLSEKLGAATVNATVLLRANPPPLPLIAIVALPATAFAAAVNVAVTGAPALAVAAENFTVTPLGTPLVDSVTGALNPPCAVTATLTVPDPPRPTVTLVGFALSV